MSNFLKQNLNLNKLSYHWDIYPTRNGSQNQLLNNPIYYYNEQTLPNAQARNPQLHLPRTRFHFHPLLIQDCKLFQIELCPLCQEEHEHQLQKYDHILLDQLHKIRKSIQTILNQITELNSITFIKPDKVPLVSKYQKKLKLARLQMIQTINQFFDQKEALFLKFSYEMEQQWKSEKQSYLNLLNQQKQDYEEQIQVLQINPKTKIKYQQSVKISLDKYDSQFFAQFGLSQNYLSELQVLLNRIFSSSESLNENIDDQETIGIGALQQLSLPPIGAMRKNLKQSSINLSNIENKFDSHLRSSSSDIALLQKFTEKQNNYIEDAVLYQQKSQYQYQQQYQQSLQQGQQQNKQNEQVQERVKQEEQQNSSQDYYQQQLTDEQKQQQQEEEKEEKQDIKHINLNQKRKITLQDFIVRVQQGPEFVYALTEKELKVYYLNRQKRRSQLVSYSIRDLGEGFRSLNLDGQLYVFGGRKDTQLYSNAVLQFDWNQASFTEIACIASQRSNFGLANIGAMVYVVGGRNLNGQLLSITTCKIHRRLRGLQHGHQGGQAHQKPQEVLPGFQPVRVEGQVPVQVWGFGGEGGVQLHREIRHLPGHVDGVLHPVVPAELPAGGAVGVPLDQRVQHPGLRGREQGQTDPQPDLPVQHVQQLHPGVGHQRNDGQIALPFKCKVIGHPVVAGTSLYCWVDDGVSHKILSFAQNIWKKVY